MDLVLTNEQMRFADERTIASGVPSLTLMERAGRALASECKRLIKGGRVLCVCGGGNNGGDGFVCARILREEGVEVQVLCVAERFSRDCEAERQRWLAIGGEILSSFSGERYALIVDCLVGTGLRGGLTGKNAELVLAINEGKKRGAKVLAADVPSGINGENGRAESVAVKADVTLCIGEYKLGAFFADGLDYSGEVKRADIGIALPREEDLPYARLVGRSDAAKWLPKRKRNSNKGTYGKAAIVGGSLAYSGASYLSASACLHSGVGYTALFLPNELLRYYYLKAPEVLLRGTNEGGVYAFNEEKAREWLDFDALAYGMGMGVSEDVACGAEFLLREYTGKLVLDADGLNALAKYRSSALVALLRAARCQVVLTPHPKELSRLTGKSVEEILAEGLRAPFVFSKACGVVTLLKGAATCVTDGKEIRVITAGNSALAKAGSGDALSGLVAGLCASGASALDGATIASFLLGEAAEETAKEEGEYFPVVSDVILRLGKAFSSTLGIAEQANEEGGDE